MKWVMASLCGLLMLGLSFGGCGIRDAGPEGAALPILWWIGGTAGIFLLSAAWWMLEGTLRRHARRDDRRDDRGDRLEPKK